MKHTTVILPKDSFVDKILKKLKIKRKIIIPEIKNNGSNIIFARKENLFICILKHLKNK